MYNILPEQFDYLVEVEDILLMLIHINDNHEQFYAQMLYNIKQENLLDHLLKSSHNHQLLFVTKRNKKYFISKNSI